MLNTHALLTLYYAGFGFVIFLAWAALAFELTRTVEPERRDKLLRLAVVLALAGVAHPGLALVGRDIARQLTRPDLPAVEDSDRVTRRSDTATVVAFAVAAVVIASHLGRFEDVPILRQIRSGLPFA